MLSFGNIARGALRESGVLSVAAAGGDAYLIILSRTCRMFAYGASSLILALFFSELGFSDSRIGLFMTLTLLGDVVLSLLLTLVADRAGRRRTLLVGSALMIISGAVFALSEDFWVLLGAAVVGVISPTGGDFGPFRAIEESMVSELTTPATRADVLVWYVTLASLGSSAGTEMSGRIIERLRKRDGWTLVDAYHGCFWLYAVMGLVNMGCTMMLSKECELKAPERTAKQGNVETEPLLLNGSQVHGPRETVEDDAKASKTETSWVAQISRETLSIIAVLWFLLMVDSLADGMANMSLTSYYMDRKFHLPKSALGDILSVSYFLSSLSNIFAGPLSRYIGLVNTMVFTHIPSSAAVLVFPLAQTVPLAVALLLLRVGLNNMDQAPRAALIAAVVRPEERTAVMGITGVLRTLASTTGPSITGLLASNDRFWVAFVVAGVLRLAYDIGVFAMFINIKLYKHERTEDELAGAEEEQQETNSPQAEP
ncbi:major facilitator superfamily domain-containing protein [Corynascus novoguineensis]|uniref:Major facilitator superfamily domain-containing protein n=1 Tax=Corynascus novoguineensis TaxID=1126955 RepID=A0AAN7CR79_9PEZI|nr:major facilitator superfamily domain-containing protein [Corynascus novoguineensis]